MTSNKHKCLGYDALEKEPWWSFFAVKVSWWSQLEPDWFRIFILLLFFKSMN